MKRLFCFLCALIIATLAAQSAYALPSSTYGSENDWFGYKDYTNTAENLDVRVIFNVYDIALGQFNWQGEDPITEGDRYIYAYQVINRGSEDANAVALFRLLDIDSNPLEQYLMHGTTSQSDGFGGIAPDSAATQEEGEWVWTPANGYIQPGEHSWFLIFSSPYEPVRGKFTIEAAQESDPIIPGDVPEPATIAFLGAAAGWLLTRRNNKRRSA